MQNIINKLQQLNIDLPSPAKPAANYLGYKISGNQIVISGQVPIVNGSFEGQQGKLGDNFTIEQGKEVARICGINILAQVNDAVNGRLDKVQCVKIGVFVNSTSDFKDHPAVANGVSDLMVEILGENGKHARAAVGVVSLPFGVAVEVDAVFEIL